MNDKDSKLTKEAKCYYREELPEEDGWLREHNIRCARRNTYYRKDACNPKDCFLYSLEEIKIKYG